MNINEAYEKTLEVIKELEKLGIKAEVHKSNSEMEQEEDMLDKSKWIHVGFIIESEKLLDKMFEKEKELHDLGISFDTGFGFGMRDWELDWSFSISTKG